MTTVVVNCAIATRGISGSARALNMILGSLRRQRNCELLEAWPSTPLRASRAWNAAVQAQWDLMGASRSASAADVLISPCNIGRSSGNQRHVLVIYDTMVLDRPELFDPGYARYAKLLFGYSARRADAILVPSRYTADRLASRWPGIVEPVVAGLPVELEPEARTRTPPASPHVLVVGATEPHKRHVDAVAAVQLARKRSGAPIRLTLVGPTGRAEGDLRAAIQQADPESQWIARKVGISDGELAGLLDSATALLQPSVFEGFGLPVLEAAAKGVPSIHSGAGSLSEVAPSGASAAAIPEAYSQAIERLLSPAKWLRRSQLAVEEASLMNWEQFDRSLSRVAGL